MGFPIWLNRTIQGVSIGTIFAQQFAPMFPPKWNSVIFSGVAIAQAVTSEIAHNYNPDGGSATEAYKPPMMPPAKF